MLLKREDVCYLISTIWDACFATVVFTRLSCLRRAPAPCPRPGQWRSQSNGNRKSVIQDWGKRACLFKLKHQHVCLKEWSVWARPWAWMCAPAAVGARRSVSWRSFCGRHRQLQEQTSSLYMTVSHSPDLPAVYRTTIANYTVHQHGIFHSKVFAMSRCPTFPWVEM